MLKHKLVDFIIQFMEEVDKEISEMKLFVRFSLSITSRRMFADLDKVKCQSPFCSGIVPDSCKSAVTKTILHD